MRGWIKTTAKLIISLALIGYLINKIGLEQLLGSIAGFNLIYLLPAVFVIIVNSIFGALNIQLLLLALGERLPFKRTLRYYLKSWAYGLFMPSKIGEFSLMVFLKRDGVSYTRGFLISLIDKLLTFVVLFGFATFGIVHLFGLKIFGIILLSVLALACMAGFFALTNRGSAILKRYLFRGFASKIAFILKDTNTLFLKRANYLFLNLIITAVKWTLVFVMLKFIFWGLGENVALLYIMTALALGTLASLIPISISGLGVLENLSVKILCYYNVAELTAGSGLLLLTTIKYLLALLIFLLV